MRYLLGIDIGTSGTKTALFDFAGHLIASHTAEYPLMQPQNGWAEQNPESWYQAAREGIRAVLGQTGAHARDIASIGLSGQMHGLTMLDADGNVLRPAILWCDQRTQAQCDAIESRLGREKLISIACNPALTGFTAGKILWVREHQPEIYEKCRHILLPKDYVRYRLTGAFATEVSDASGTLLFSVPERKWSGDILSALEIDRALLPEATESIVISACVSRRAAEETGLAPGTPVAGGAGDNAAAAVGTGTVRDGRAFTTIGTSGVVYAHTNALRVDPQGRAHAFCCAVPGAWHVMGVTQAAGLSLKWLRDTLCAAEKEAAARAGMDAYDLMGREAALSPIGANKLLYLPYLMGERTPHLDASCRGAFIGLTALHQMRDITRAVMEGVSYSLCDCVGVIRDMGQTITRMAACGGGAKSALWRQMLSDLFDCDIVPVQTEGASLGAALLAGVGAGVYKSVPEACDICVRYGQALSPDAARRAEYQKYYAVYQALYPALKASFRALSAL